MAMTNQAETHVVTCFLRNRGKVLLLRRSEDVGSYAGQWGAVAGHAEGDPDAAAWTEIAEETGLEGAVTLVRRGASFAVDDEELGTRWVVHPYLFDCERRDASINWETTKAEWVTPTAILRRDTVPDLWRSYEHVAPTAERVAGDHEHGSAYISICALEVLRDCAGVLAHEGGDPDDAWHELHDEAVRLLETRPSMAALRNRVNHVMYECMPELEPAVVEKTAHAAIERAFRADARTAQRAAGYVAGRRVLTLSRSGTVLQALRQADPAPAVIVAESRPDREGVYVAETLARDGLDVTLITDAAVATLLGEETAGVVLVGADTTLPSGAVINKTGTRMAALAAHHESIPFYVTMATDKVTTDDTPHLEEGTPEALYAGEAPLSVRNPTFEVTPAALVSGFITEQGILHPSEMRDVAYELKAWSRWMEEKPSDSTE